MYCSSCGRELVENLRFCDGCGFELGDGSAASSTTLSQQVKGEVKARSLDAWRAFKQFAKSPVGGLPVSFSMLDDQRAIQVGIVFAGLYEVSLLIGILIFKSKVTSLLGAYLPIGDLTISQFLKVLLLGLVPFAALIGALALVRAIFRGTGGISGDFYTAGAVLLPVGFFALASSILGAANVEVIGILLLFAMTYSVLILYSGCSRIGGIAETGAAPAVPIILLVSVWITKILVMAIW